MSETEVLPAERRELVVSDVQPKVPAVIQEFSVEEVVARVTKVRELYRAVMQKDVHYGVIQGTDKPTILQPGVDLLSMMFRLDSEFSPEIVRDGDHREVISHCTVIHIPTGMRVASADAVCSTRESKYAWRNAQRLCPECGKAVIIKGRPEYGGGWICFAKIGGCGAKYAVGSKEIESQQVGRVPNPDLADTYNTVLKMANKRSKATAILNATAATEVFTVDLEDFDDPLGGDRDKKPRETVDTSTSQETAPEPRRRGRPPKPVETVGSTENVAPSEPEGQQTLFSLGQPGADTDVISANDLGWLRQEALATGAMFDMMVKQYAPDGIIRYGDLAKMKQILERRRKARGR